MKVPTGAFVARRNGKVFVTGNSGFPKAHDLSKAIDRAAGAEREVVGKYQSPENTSGVSPGTAWFNDGGLADITAPATALARQWAGWAYGLQSLKPALEPICLAQKPFAEVTSDEIHALTGWDHWCSSRSDGDDKIVTARSLRPEARSYRARFDKDGRELAREDLGEYAPFVLDNGTANCLKHGTGALNIDSCRVAIADDDPHIARGSWSADHGTDHARPGYDGGFTTGGRRAPNGRWPAQILHDGSPEVMEAFARFGERHSQDPATRVRKTTTSNSNPFHGYNSSIDEAYKKGAGFGDTGTAARFFFCGKAQAWEREGSHPTVKPVALCEWLVKLVTPPGGRVLDPFCGTGSILVACDWLGFDAVGIEQDEQTCRDAEAKIKRLRARRMLGDAPRHEPLTGQLGLF